MDYCLIPEVALSQEPIHTLCVNAVKQCATHMSVHPKNEWGDAAISQMAGNVQPSQITGSEGGIKGCISNEFTGTCNILLNRDVGGMWTPARDNYAASFSNVDQLRNDTISLVEPPRLGAASYVAFRTPP